MEVDEPKEQQVGEAAATQSQPQEQLQDQADTGQNAGADSAQDAEQKDVKGEKEQEDQGKPDEAPQGAAEETAGGEVEKTEDKKEEKQEVKEEVKMEVDEPEGQKEVKEESEVKKKEEEVKEEAKEVASAGTSTEKSEPKAEKEEVDKVNQEVKVLLAPLPEGAIAEAKENMGQEQQQEEEEEEEGESDKENDSEGPEEVVPVELADACTQTRRAPNRTRAVTACPEVVSIATQTDGPVYPPIVPMPCPMWMPVPFGMYTTPAPTPVPVPLPVPIPVMVPTTRNSYRGIRKQIRKIVSKVPANLLEVELLKLAAEITGEKVAGVDYYESEDSEAEDDDYDEAANGDPSRPTVPPMDLEKDVRGDRILPKALPAVTPDPAISPGPNSFRGDQLNRPRGGGGGRGGRGGGQKRRYSTQTRERAAKQAKQDSPASQAVLNMVNVQPKERPDAKHHLKFTYGVNAWRHWVVQKNAELEKLRAQGKYMKTFDTDILKLRADELIYTLCMFVKEVKKPNGEEYTPDSIFYLTLGIQEYLFENGRIDNIFTDTYYEPFTSALHEIVKDFKLPVNELGYFVTRIEEEHLWEAKQLGAHSPQVLLNTVIYFNTKYFLLKTVDHHKKLSFSHIMKHWKRSLPNPASRENQAAVPGLEKKTILLRYYPPAANKPGKQQERKCYEQHENPESPLRCPVKLYEFYLSKCPESTKSRNDLFYLQPERSCLPESPVWYSSNPLNNHQLDKMLQRLLMVREVQEHMLAEASENIP